MNETIITSVKTYIDIDAYAGIIAYRHLLSSLGKVVIGVSTAVINESISPIIKDIELSLDNFDEKGNQKFIVLDVSNPEMFDKIVDNKNIIEIIDHHTGFEQYWKEKNNITTQIEFIGSICTIIFEKYKSFNRLEILNSDICKLLIAGILDNTLNLKASITTERDINAYNSLLKIGYIDKSWGNEYFLSCQELIEQNLLLSIKNDLKIEYVNENLPEVFGQLLVLNKDSILEKKDEIIEIMNGYSNEWIFNLISLSDGKSYIISNNEMTKQKIEKLFESNFHENILILDKFMLRKEIIKKARNYKD